MSGIWDSLNNNKLLLSLILICIGAVECFYGLKILPATLFIIGYLVGFGLIASIMAEFIVKPGASILLVWASLIIAMLFGIFLGYITTSIRKVGFFVLGFWLGTIISFLLYNMFIYKLSNHSTPLWIMIFVFGIGIGYLSGIYYKHIVIIGTSLTGSFTAIRSIGFLVGGFPNEFEIA